PEKRMQPTCCRPVIKVAVRHRDLGGVKPRTPTAGPELAFSSKPRITRPSARSRPGAERTAAWAFPGTLFLEDLAVGPLVRRPVFPPSTAFEPFPKGLGGFTAGTSSS